MQNPLGASSLMNTLFSPSVVIGTLSWVLTTYGREFAWIVKMMGMKAGMCDMQLFATPGMSVQGSVS